MEYLYTKKHIFITLSVYACIKEGILVLKDLCSILLLITLQQSNIFKFNSHQYTHRDPYIISIHKLEYIGVYVNHITSLQPSHECNTLNDRSKNE